MTATTPRAEDRHRSPYTAREKVGRMLWGVVQGTVFRYSFHTWNPWRAWLLNCFGARVHPTCTVRRTVRIQCPWNLAMDHDSCLGDRAIVYCLGPVTIGRRVSISQQAHLCAGTHDYTRPDMPLERPPIVIEDDAWLAADTFVGPGVTVGEGAILGARAVAMRDLAPWTIHVGNPAAKVKDRPRFDP